VPALLTPSERRRLRLLYRIFTITALVLLAVAALSTLFFIHHIHNLARAYQQIDVSVQEWFVNVSKCRIWYVVTICNPTSINFSLDWLDLSPSCKTKDGLHPLPGTSQTTYRILPPFTTTRVDVWIPVSETDIEYIICAESWFLNATIRLRGPLGYYYLQAHVTLPPPTLLESGILYP